jgi:prepilin-type N-terminal cleavage/methylation domain-containing protein
MPRQKKITGFSLVEVLITIAIIGILAAIIPTTLSDWILTHKANLTASQISTDLIYARTKAISHNNSYIITFYASPNGNCNYEIHDDENDNGVRDAGEVVISVALASGIQFGTNPGIKGIDNNSIDSQGIDLGPDNSISFDPRGYASESGALYLIPTRDLSFPNRNDRMRAISILQATGQVKVWKYSAGAANPGPWVES